MAILQKNYSGPFYDPYWFDYSVLEYNNTTKNLKIEIYNIITLPVVLCGCEAWSLTLREECRLRVLENRIPRRIFGPKRDDNAEWRRLHNEELHSLYRSPNIVRVIKTKIEMGRACSQNGGR